MKSHLFYLLLSMIFFIGCATQKGSKEDYFGYTNSPTINVSSEISESIPTKKSTRAISTVVKIDPTPETSFDGWVNPLTQPDDDQDDFQDSPTSRTTTVIYRPYSAPEYVPVIVPWWDYYSGWMGGYYSRPVISVRYRDWYWGWNSYCDWYSPYYSYHPWYGGNFSNFRPRYYGWNDNCWRPWHHYPIHTYGHVPTSPIKPNTVRSWGPTRGEITNNAGGIRGTTLTPNQTSTIPSVRNSRSQSSGSSKTFSNPTNNPQTSVRNEREMTSGALQQSGQKLPLHRNESTSTIKDPKHSKDLNIITESPIRPERVIKEKTPSSRTPNTSQSSGSSLRQERSTKSESIKPASSSSSTSSPSSTPSSTSRGTRKP